MKRAKRQASENLTVSKPGFELVSEQNAAEGRLFTRTSTVVSPTVRGFTMGNLQLSLSVETSFGITTPSAPSYAPTIADHLER